MPSSKMERDVTGVIGTNRAGAIIAAAGSSQRMQGVDKLFAPLAGRPLLSWTIEAFQLCDAIQDIVIVVNEANVVRTSDLAAQQRWSKVVEVCPGGPRRQDSVSRGLDRLSACGWVVVHDGARPCVTPELIRQGLAEARRTGAAIAAVPVTDTIKLVRPDGSIKETLPRSTLWAAQTPQVFRIDMIRSAYTAAHDDVTDDASLVEKMGQTVTVFKSGYDNIKVTTPQDLVLAEWILERRRHGSYGHDASCA